MSSAPASIRQAGYVVRDLDTAISRWLQQTGAGPFVKMTNHRFEGWNYFGKPQDMVLDIAFAMAGTVMIELIQPHGPWPSVYGTAEPEEGSYLHHFGFLVDDIDRAASRLSATLVTAAKVDDETELRYFDCRNMFGVHFELISNTDSAQAFFELSQNLADEWDGSKPSVRSIEEFFS